MAERHRLRGLQMGEAGHDRRGMGHRLLRERVLQAGELAGGIGVAGGGSADVKPLFPNAAAAEADWYQRTGAYPMTMTPDQFAIFIRTEADRWSKVLKDTNIKYD